jgi:hypothetical protein
MLSEKVQQIKSILDALQSADAAENVAYQSRIDALIEERDALQAKLDELLKPPAIKFTPSMLRFAGGYRIPETWFGGRSVAFSKGGITAKHDADGRLRLWLTHHAQNVAVAEYVAPTQRGFDRGANTGPDWTYHPVARWPIATHVRTIDGVYQSQRNRDGSAELHGLYYDAESNQVLASGLAWYNTTNAFPDFIVSIDAVTGTVGQSITPGLPQQAFGGGFVTIPQSFADTHCGGNTIGLSKGGYQSGQESATSPTLAAWGTAPTKVLQWSQWNAPTSQREQRDANYSNGGITWQPNPINGVGYWGVDRVKGQAWIHTDSMSAVVHIVLQPTGAMNYAGQKEVFSDTAQYRMYVYDATQFAEVASGMKQPHEVRGKWYPLPPGMPFGSPSGMWWDDVRKLLSIVYVNGWWTGGSETYPVVCEFEVV